MGLQQGVFRYEALPMRVRFGTGEAAHLAEEIDALGGSRALLICSPGRERTVEALVATLGERCVGVFAQARTHVPVELAHQASELAADLGADTCVTVGGGSAIGLGKAISLEHGLPVIAVPTTYSGSEMSPVWGLTENGHKRTGRDRRVLPRSVIYDVELTMDLPGPLSVTSGFNAVAHAVEALYAPDASPIVSLMAVEAVTAMAEALPRLAVDGSDLEARTFAQYGGWLAGACLGATTMSLHHRLCHVLGGALDLPHAPTHTVLLPHVLAFNTAAAPSAIALLSTALGDPDPASALRRIERGCAAPMSLQALGMSEDDIEAIAELTLATPVTNPRPADRDDLLTLLQDAWTGNLRGSSRAPR
jgi:maleylacetate reductase